MEAAMWLVGVGIIILGLSAAVDVFVRLRLDYLAPRRPPDDHLGIAVDQHSPMPQPTQAPEVELGEDDETDGEDEEKKKRRSSRERYPW